MTSQQSKKYTLGEVSIIVENIDSKLDSIKEETKGQFETLGQGMDKLSSALSDMVKYRAEMEGVAQATKYWTALIVTIIMAISGVLFKLTLESIEHNIIAQTNLSDQQQFNKLTEWVDANYEVKQK
jgi:ABC-type phosphate/phosphonate transport system permease subunit